MTSRLDHRGWTAAEHTGPCVLCGKPAILRSPESSPATGPAPWH
jgi:hypothetical protein